MLNVDNLAKEINKAIDAKDKDGNPQPVTPEQKAYAKAVIDTYKAASTAHALVTADTVAAAPITNGAAENGLLVGFTQGPWIAATSAGFPGSNPAMLAVEASGSVAYLLGASKINFEAGNIQGVSTATPTSPGPLAAGLGVDGKVIGIDGAPWASSVMPPGGDPGLAKKIYDAITKYIKDNAEIAYASGSVNGTCPAVSGPLTLGVAVGGVIT